MEKKYKALRTIVIIQIASGWLLMILGLIINIYLMVNTQEYRLFKQFPIQSILYIISSIIGGIFLIAVGQLIQVLIDIEENTRNFSLNQVELLKSNTTSSTSTKASTQGNLTDDKNNFDGVRITLSKEARGDLKIDPF